MTQVEAVEKADDTRIGPGRIREKYDKGVKATNSQTQRYYENVAFLQGEQWIYYSKTRNTLLEVPRDDSSRVRATVNRLASTKRRLLAKTLKKPLVFEVPPTGADDATIQGARISESILSDLRREQDWETLREELTIAAFDGGTGLLCLDWDASAGEELEVDETTGRPVGTGEVKFSVLAVTEAVTEPGTRDIERAQWWIKAQGIPAKEVQEMYGLEQSPAADATSSLSPVQQRVLQTDRSTATNDLALVLTYYERPSSKNPQGQVQVVVGDKTVEGPLDWPFPFDDHLNVTAARETKVLGRWTGDTILSQAVPVQTLYNQIWSSIAEHTKLAGNARILWPAFSGDGADSLSDLPSEIIEYMPQANGAKPEWWSPPQLPAWMLDQVERLKAEMDDILGAPDVFRGEAPRNIESGSGLAILSEQAETPVAKLATEVADAFARCGSWALECYEENVEETRDARVDYPHQVSETVSWSGKDIQGQTRAIVPENAVLPVSEAETWTKGVNLYDRDFFMKADGTRDYAAFARFISASGEDNFVEATDPDVAKAQRENYRMALGEPLEPAPWDDHAKHIEVLNTYRKSASYERLSPETQGIFEMHAMANQVLAAEDAAAATNLQLQDIGTGNLAGIPTANQVRGTPPPPGSLPTQNGMGGAPTEMAAGEMVPGEML